MRHPKKLTEQVPFIVNLSSGSSGLTLPVWVTAAAKAATQVLVGQQFLPSLTIVLPDRKESLTVPVSSAALIAGGNQAIGISYADSHKGLDITRNLEIWACVKLQQKPEDTDGLPDSFSDSWLKLVAGMGVGKHESTGDLCLSGFARELLHCNLRSLVPTGHTLRVEIVFPAGRELAKRTSNEAFGVVEGLALIGTQAEAQISASPEQLQSTIESLRSKCAVSNFADVFIFVIGENGFDLALKLGFSPTQILKVGNWVGPLLIVAAESGVKKLLLLGYHGKLVKLAGGIFHTHHHLADGRLEVLTALAVAERIPLHLIQSIGEAASVEAALLSLELTEPEFAQNLWDRVALVVEQRSNAYVARYGSWPMEIGAALFDRQRQIRWAGPCGCQQLDVLGVTLEK
ncbi:cobalt-precorrin-5B (C(1))-methyltransferase CbiD [Prochlorococcus sp. MIT 1307]|uniref:cobalt-precorrin-5B (C(1))-methyltransferase CbiD n=1 Tax=Prochlorococcus sp. MIT 1307 TaxID=3096219 RepID=UPI002A74C90C|nr:cobalt-precorrin-5B (C(1))-methyltransferase CbiD [Prochlorococcus sp. MIT 1307]